MFKSKFIKDKNYLLLFFGNLVSGIGSRVYGFGISLFLLDLTRQASATAIYVAVWTVIMFVFAPIAATFTDRLKYKAKVLYLTDFGRGICYTLTAIVLMFALKEANTIMIQLVIYIAVFFIATQTAFFSPAVNALTPQIVEKDELVSASSIMQITNSVQNLAGLFFGAILYVHFGIIVLIFINAVSFILSGISEMFIKLKEEDLVGTYQINLEGNQLSVKDRFKQIGTDLKGAVNYLFTQGKPILMVTFIIFISATLVSPWFSIGVPYMFKEYFSFTSFQPDYILASTNFIESVGVILMSLVVAQIAFRFKIFQILRVAIFAFILLSLVFLVIIKSYDYKIITQNSFLYLYLAFTFIAGLINATVNAPLNASMYKYIDKREIGKVSTVVNCVGGLLYPITAIIAGYMIDFVDFYIPLYVSIFALMLMGIVIMRSKELKKLV
ncbi:MAG: MFS transporter [Candidatus Izemoplasmatales bacterium]